MAVREGTRVRETTTTTGTGTVTLGGAVSQCQAFSNIPNIVTGDFVRYELLDGNGTDWERGLGTFISGSPNTFARTYVAESTNSGNAINLSTNTHKIINISAISHAINPTQGFKNRINGDMRIDKRNNGASGTAINAYTLDRWQYTATQASKGTWGQNLNAITPPSGFKYYLGFQSSSSYSLLAGDYFEFRQPIEAANIQDFAFGKSNAQPITLSFLVRSSLTGTFGGSIGDYAGTRFFPFSYSIDSANVWKLIKITIPGDTSGSWVLEGTGGGCYVQLGLGAGSNYSVAAGSWSGTTSVSCTGATSVVGTNGATWYVTGVHLELGSEYTSFEQRPYGVELDLCYRYFYNYMAASTGDFISSNGGVYSSSYIVHSFTVNMPVTMRSAPGITNSMTNGNWSQSPSSNQWGMLISNVAWSNKTSGTWSFGAQSNHNEGIILVTLSPGGFTNPPNIMAIYGLSMQFSAEL